MRLHELSVGKSPHTVRAVVVECGPDLSVTIGGGPLPHVGAVALGVPRPSLADSAQLSASASVLCATGHKEDMLARHVALKLATRYDCRVQVSVGMHIDGATRADITAFENNTEELLKEICGILDGTRSLG
ncbi:MAG: hypothetical protein LBS17_03025 [Actinomycetes bacterium]|jgi:hypothetical protein|nr:hypothetical protein [Actinomycetes bacterium]